MSERLIIANLKANASISDEVLNLWLGDDNDKKLVALFSIRKKLELPSIANPYYFEIARRYLKDPDSDCKWQSFIIIGEYMQVMADECWQLIIEFGSSDDQDTRMAVATTLLEHYFEENPHLFGTKFRELEQRVESGDRNLFETLTSCRSGLGNREHVRQLTILLQDTKIKFKRSN